jgi:RNA polymerase sigma factor (sigma-70 family)
MSNSDLRAYMLTVSKGVSIDARRRHARRDRHGEIPFPFAAFEPTTLEAQVEARRLLSQVFLVLASWPEVERDVFVMSEVHGKTKCDIGKHLGLPTGTVKTILRRTRARIRSIRPNAIGVAGRNSR